MKKNIMDLDSGCNFCNTIKEAKEKLQCMRSEMRLHGYEREADIIYIQCMDSLNNIRKTLKTNGVLWLEMIQMVKP